jgi:cell fate regulator YaaT (PSP1 superfamily)
MEYIGEFKYSPGALSACGVKVVLQTNRGIEIGEQVSLTCSGCQESIDRQQMLEYVRHSNASEFFQPKAGRILRLATPQDLTEDARIRQDARGKLVRARELAASLGLQMKIVACEHLFGGERIIFHFMAEDRVDFRELVHQLAHEYHTRIEMHQVGARDEARLVADYEMCGRECCCKNFLKKLRPVTMRMAKLQKATLDPSKVSGRCGRLRCCLRYEYEGYDELSKKLPRLGTRVRTDRGIGTVKDRQILTQLVTILLDDLEHEETIGVEQILEQNLPKRPPAPPTKDEQEGEAAGQAPLTRRDERRRPRGRDREAQRQTGPQPRPEPEFRADAQAEGDVEAVLEEALDHGPGGAGFNEAPPAAGKQVPESAGPAGAYAEPPRRRRRGRRGRRRGRQGRDASMRDANGSGPPGTERRQGEGPSGETNGSSPGTPRQAGGDAAGKAD